MDYPDGSHGKESACNAGDPGLIPGLGRSPGEGKVYPLQHSCLENSMEESGRLQVALFSCVFPPQSEYILLAGLFGDLLLLCGARVYWKEDIE